jgi:fructose-1,6-bisphosphatase-3
MNWPHLYILSEAEINKKKKNKEDFDKWCYRPYTNSYRCAEPYPPSIQDQRCVKDCRSTGITVWMNFCMPIDEENKSRYYSKIIESIIESRMAEDFIEELAVSISNLAVDKLHIIGDIFDRGAHPMT